MRSAINQMKGSHKKLWSCSYST